MSNTNTSLGHRVSCACVGLCCKLASSLGNLGASLLVLADAIEDVAGVQQRALDLEEARRLADAAAAKREQALALQYASANLTQEADELDGLAEALRETNTIVLVD